MTRIAAIYAPKGGVGKTFLTAHLATGLAMTGRKVLAIDMDATQCQLVISFADLVRRGDTAGLFTSRPGSPIDHLVQPPGGYPLLHVITGTPETSRTIPNWLRTTNPAFWVTTLKERLAPLMGQYDYILMDCGPGLDEVTQCVLHAATELWLPYRVDYKSLDSYLLLTEQILPQLRRSPDDFITHVIPNFLTLGGRSRRPDGLTEVEARKYELARRARSNDAAAILEELKNTFGGKLTPPIRVAEAAALRSDGTGEVIWTFAPDSAIADDLSRVLEDVINYEEVIGHGAA